jgi:hypothetical protein
MYLKEGGRGKKKVRKREEGTGNREDGKRKKEENVVSTFLAGG